MEQKKNCKQCNHRAVCRHIDKVLTPCDHFQDEQLIVNIPCAQGTIVYRAEKDCDACSRCQQAYYSDCVTCADDHNLYDPVVQSELCRKHIRFKPVDFKAHMIEQIGLSIFLSPEDFWKKIDKENCDG